MQGLLALVRHGESQWNAKNIWTGITDIGLSEKGRQEACLAASRLSDVSFQRAYTSALSRAKDTLTIILDILGRPDIPVEINAALNERDYGVYTGKNKFEIQKILGKEEFLRLRRGWEYPIENGESLKQVYARVVPYFETHIQEHLRKGEHILLVAHGNSLRALIKKLDKISDEDIANQEIATGEIIIYTFDNQGNVCGREKRKITS